MWKYFNMLIYEYHVINLSIETVNKRCAGSWFFQPQRGMKIHKKQKYKNVEIKF